MKMCKNYNISECFLFKCVTLVSHVICLSARPNFLIRPRDQRIGLNGIAKMECSATGNPPPSIFWTKEGNQVIYFPYKV